MAVLKVNASKLISAILALAVVSLLLAAIVANHRFATGEALKTFDVSESLVAAEPIHDMAAMEPPPADGMAPPEEEQALFSNKLPAVSPPPVVSPPPLAMPHQPMMPQESQYQELRINRETNVARAPVSTFAADVDTASYANIRRMIRAGEPVPPEAVRVEEMVNYFRYDLALPQDNGPIAITTDVTRTPWNDRTLLLRVALAAKDVPASARPAANLVFLVDVSGSMDSPDRLDLVKRALTALASQVRPQDRVSIVTYAGDVGIALAPTGDRSRIKRAVAQLAPGGGTAGGAGMALAYEQARRAFIAGGINRIVLATDGDFNVGVSDPAALKRMVERERDRGVTLSTLGVGEYNDRLMETLADAGDGNASFIDGDAEIAKVLGRELSGTLQVVAKDVKAQVEFNPAAISSYRQVGYENRQLAERDFDDDRIDAGDIGAGHQVTALYEITPAAQDVASRRRYAANRTAGVQATALPEALFVKIRYKQPSGGRSMLLQQALPGDALARATEPSGDTAFAAAVAAFGQHLKNDPAVAGFGRSEILSLAGPHSDPLRREFTDLVRGVSAAPGIVPASPAIPYFEPEQVPAKPSSAGAVLALLALMLGGLVLFVIGRPKRHVAAEPTGSHGDPPLCPAVAEARKAAALSTAFETGSAIADFTGLVTRARALEGCDGDVAAEIEAIAERHAPGLLREYASGRARAASGREAELERNLRSALQLLSARLAELLDQQTSRDACRIETHESFLRQRHFQPPPLTA